MLCNQIIHGLLYMNTDITAYMILYHEKYYVRYIMKVVYKIMTVL